MDSKMIRGYLTRADELPTLPEVAFQVMEKLQDSESSASDIVQVIERDPAMTTKLLKVANSAYYGMSRQVDSLKMAVVILGIRQCASLVIGMSTFQRFAKYFSNDLEFYYELWRHLVSTAQISSALADYFRLDDPPSIYTGGMLHDIGKILLSIKFPKQYPALLKQCKETSASLEELEKQHLNVSHCMAGGWLAEEWQFPPNLTTILSDHHLLNQQSNYAIDVAVVSLADCFCRQEFLGSSGNYETSDFFADKAWAPLFLKGWGKDLSERQAIYQKLLEQKERISHQSEEFLEICAA
jgi:putative nucleotidyltransferase with HDIG domain